MTEVRVELGSRSYSVHVGAGLIGRLGLLTREAAAGRGAFVITDSNVGPLYANAAGRSLAEAGYAVEFAQFPAGEPNKTLATVSGLFDAVFAAKHSPDRQSVVVALGGGVVGDVAGFVAATLLRGVKFVQVPTSLLADVDSSVGGKTGVDHPAGKNLIGVFHQPAAVFIDTAVLKTLPAVELSSGLAECVKHGMIRDESLVSFIERHAEQVRALDDECVSELIARNVRIKAAVVSADEREGGQRAHLNFGHTIGHAIEAAEGFDAARGDAYLRHGHCVALGMVAANHIAVARGLLDAAQAQRIETLLARLDLPTRRNGLQPDALLDTMRHDKKVQDGAVRFVLPRGIGQADVFADVADREVLSAIDYLSV